MTDSVPASVRLSIPTLTLKGYSAGLPAKLAKIRMMSHRSRKADTGIYLGVAYRF